MRLAENLETVALDVFNKLGRGSLPGFDTAYLELILAYDLPEVLCQRAGVALARRLAVGGRRQDSPGRRKSSSRGRERPRDYCGSHTGDIWRDVPCIDDVRI